MSADTVHHDSGQTNTGHIDTDDNCETCKTLNESTKLHCGSKCADISKLTSSGKTYSDQIKF